MFLVKNHSVIYEHPKVITGNPVLGEKDSCAVNVKANNQQAFCPVEFAAGCTFTEVLGRG